mgnify:CR=1 FL=1
MEWRKSFTLENYPDSTWTFVDSKTMVKEQGYEPPIHDFSIIRQEDGEDITDEVLDDDNYTFLLVAHQLSQADDSTIDLIMNCMIIVWSMDINSIVLPHHPIVILKTGRSVREPSILSA